MTTVDPTTVSVPKPASHTVQTGPMTEALCECGETFNMTEGEQDLVHIERQDGTPCGRRAQHIANTDHDPPYVVKYLAWHNAAEAAGLSLEYTGYECTDLDDFNEDHSCAIVLVSGHGWYHIVERDARIIAEFLGPTDDPRYAIRAPEYRSRRPETVVRRWSEPGLHFTAVIRDLADSQQTLYATAMRDDGTAVGSYYPADLARQEDWHVVPAQGEPFPVDSEQNAVRALMTASGCQMA